MTRETPSHASPASPRIARRALALTALLASGLLVWMALPRLQASVQYLPVDTAISRYRASGEVPFSQLPALQARAVAAAARYPHYRYFDGLSFLLYLQALDTDAPRAERLEALRASLAAANQAVLRAPAKPATWLRIARIRSALGQGDDAVVPPLKMSILTGRVEPTLLLPRLELGLRYLRALDAESVALLRDQAVLTWRVEPRRFSQALKLQRLDLEQVKSLLGSANAGLIAELEATL